ncbi:MAG: RluA family pseudouridine synthase [Patescibacteria group bacterium]
MKIKILYEDSNILAIDKPSGILVHPDQKSKEKTILDLFLKKYPKIEIVHRLDKETSGVMLLAKNKKTYEFLKSQFSAPALEIAQGGLADRQNRIKKTYIAIVNGWVKNDHGIINKPIGRSPKDFRRHLAGRGVRGELREAITEYKVLKRFELEAEDCNFFYARGSQPVLGEGRSAKKNYNAPLKFSYLEIHPKTGRTHQIRVHMKYLNHPVVCDSLYNPKGACPLGLNRLALHAKSIEFKNLKGKIVKVESPLPKKFKKLVDVAG